MSLIWANLDRIMREHKAWQERETRRLCTEIEREIIEEHLGAVRKEQNDALIGSTDRRCRGRQRSVR